MSKSTPEHLSRSAYVYVRQSTPGQIINNPESRRRQYGLAVRARALGWENVIVIDDDLGRSGGGAARPGFERLLTAICTGTAGAVFAIRPHVWPAMAAIGIPFWSSALWSAASSSTRTVCTIQS